MKVTANVLKQNLANTRSYKKGYLIWGRDESLVAQYRDHVIVTIAGPDAYQDFRVERIELEELVATPERLELAVSAHGFFEGQRVVCLNNANDRATPHLKGILESHDNDMATLIVTAGSLKPASKLRKLFETSLDLVATTIYSDHPNDRLVHDMLSKAGIRDVPFDVSQYLTFRLREHAPSLAPMQIEKIALYKANDSTPLSIGDINVCFPETVTLAVDALLDAVIAKKPILVGSAFRKLEDRDRNPVMLCIRAKRIFRNLLKISSHPEGFNAGLMGISPPVFGTRRAHLINCARIWGVEAIQTALIELARVDRKIRTGGSLPKYSLIERTFLRIALLKTAR